MGNYITHEQLLTSNYITHEQLLMSNYITHEQLTTHDQHATTNNYS